MAGSDAVFSGNWGDAANPGFGLEAGDVAGIQQQLRGCPVTLNHTGLQTAIDNITSVGNPITAAAVRTQLDGAAGAAARPIGTILSADPASTSVMFTLNSNFSGLAELIRAGLYNGLSLTHVASASGAKEPLEVSLTTDPARSCSHITSEYKPSLIEVVSTAAMSAENAAAPVATPAPAEEPAVVEKTPLESALEALSPEQQQVVLSRLQEYETKHSELSSAAETAAAEAKAAQEEAARQLQERAADKEVVKAQIESLRTLLTQNGCANEAERLAAVPGYLDQNSIGHSQLALEQVVSACNRALSGVNVARPAKRRTTEATAVAAPVAAAASAPLSAPARYDAAASASVRNLLRTNFDAC